MDIRVQAYTPPLPATPSRAVASAAPAPTVSALATLGRQPNASTNNPSSADRAKTAAAAAFASSPATQAINQPTARGGVAFTSDPEPGQLVNILV